MKIQIQHTLRYYGSFPPLIFEFGLSLLVAGVWQGNTDNNYLHAIKGGTVRKHSGFVMHVEMSKACMIVFHVISPQLTVQCYPKNKAPCEMIRGSATSDHHFAYFIPSGSTSLYSYEWNTKQWEELPSCQYDNSALVIINGELTTVGGGSRCSCTNKLLTLRQRRWIEEYPPMEFARSKPAVVSTPDGDYIIVIGGSISAITWLDIVELLQVKTGQWYELTNLPQPLLRPSATICGNQVHVIGTRDNGYSCSLQALTSSDETITPQSLRHLISWTPLPRLPLSSSTAATLSGQLVIIGGSRGLSPVNFIHQLVDGQWVNIYSMYSKRRDCLPVSPSPERVMIVGGDGAEDSVEECIVVNS